MSRLLLVLTLALLSARLVLAQNATPEATDQPTILTVSPEDDPTAARCEIELVAEKHVIHNVIQVLAKITTPTVFDRSSDGEPYVEHCLMIAFQKQGYSLWDDRYPPKTVIIDDDGTFFVYGTFDQK